MGNKLRIASIVLFLFGFWLILSGHYTPWLIGAGLLSSIGVVLVALRFGIVDGEGHPVERLVSGFVYWPWLIKEIALSAWQVTKVILDPALPISPRQFRVRTSQKTAVGVATYANSITLTPGTITVEVDRETRELDIHALTSDAAEGLAGGEMDRRVTAFERMA